MGLEGHRSVLCLLRKGTVIHTGRTEYSYLVVAIHTGDLTTVKVVSSTAIFITLGAFFLFQMVVLI